jgi:ferredoxin
MENGYLATSIHRATTKKHLQVINCDYIVVAIGQKGNVSDYDTIGSEKLTVDNKIKVDTDTGFSNYKNIYVAGDICNENHMSLIGAIASGKRAVIGIKKQLEGYEHGYEGIDSLLTLNNKESEGPAMQPINMDEDLNSYISKFNLFQSCEKCNHCIDNLGCPAMIKVDGKIIIDYPKCTNCGLCIDVCPNDAIGWVKESELNIVAETMH